MPVLANDLYIGNVSGEYSGYANDSAQLTVNVRTYTREGTYESVTHRMVTDPVGISISAGVRYRTGTDYTTCGQIRDALDHVVSYKGLWNARQVKRLGQVWDRWHLSDMRAGCKGTGQHAEIGTPCPTTPYTYGRKWLVEPVPAEVIAELKEMFK